MSQVQHRELAAGRWQTLSLVEQLANVGSEVERALRWTAKGNSEYSRLAFERALELIDLTIEDPKHRGRLKELTRLREVLVDYFVGENAFSSSERVWQSYFRPYGFAASLARAKLQE